MATYSKPQITISTTPDRYSPAYGLNYFTFTASFADTTAYNPFLIVDFNRLSQWSTASVLLANTASRYKVPIRENNEFIFNVEQIAKNYLTYPYNDKIYGGVHNNTYVNEASGFGTPTQSFPTLAPDTDTILKYNLTYGLEFNPGVTFSRIGGTTGSFGTYSTYEIIGQNLFCDAGDYIQIEMNSGIFNYYNGIHEVRTISTASFGPTITYITTNQIPNETLLSITAVTGSGGLSVATGYITNCKKMYGTSSQFSVWNGVRQWEEKGVDFTDLYLMEASSNANLFLEEWGYDSNHCIPIGLSHSYRARFLASLYAGSGTQSRLSEISWDVYNTSNATVSTTTNILQDSPGGSIYTNNCFSVQVFDYKYPIIKDYKYKFSLIGGDSFNATTFSLWFVGYNPCSQYETIRIKWMNKLGSWSYWYFNKDLKQTTTINTTTYKHPYDYDYSLDFTKPNFTLFKSRGDSVLSKKLNETYLLNSDWVTEEEYAYLNEIVTSPQVFIFYDFWTDKSGKQLQAVNIPIIITDTTYEWKTRMRNKLFNLQINYRLSYDTISQNP